MLQVQEHMAIHVLSAKKKHKCSTTELIDNIESTPHGAYDLLQQMERGIPIHRSLPNL